MPSTDTISVLSRSGDPDTSVAAAESQVKNLSKLQGIVLSLFESTPDFGLTDSEVDRFYANNQQMHGWPAVRFETPRRRRSDLTRDGFLEDSGIRRVNPFGRLEVVWVVSK